MSKNLIIDYLCERFENNKLSEKKLYDLVEKVNYITNKKAEKIVINHESIGGMLSLSTLQNNKCIEKCKGSDLIYYKRRMCVHGCYIQHYKNSLKVLKKELQTKKSNEEKDKIRKRIFNMEDKLQKSIKKYNMYKKSGFLKNAYVNQYKDLTLDKLED